ENLWVHTHDIGNDSLDEPCLKFTALDDGKHPGSSVFLLPHPNFPSASRECAWHPAVKNKNQKTKEKNDDTSSKNNAVRCHGGLFNNGGQNLRRNWQGSRLLLV